MSACTRCIQNRVRKSNEKKNKNKLRDEGFPKLRESAIEQVRVINGSLKRADSLKDI